jgi:hypothetical protein
VTSKSDATVQNIVSPMTGICAPDYVYAFLSYFITIIARVFNVLSFASYFSNHSNVVKMFREIQR